MSDIEGVYIGLALFALVIIFISQGMVVVKQAEVIIIERLGRYHATLESGLNFIIPIIDSKKESIWRFSVKSNHHKSISHINKRVTRIDLREEVYDFPKQNVITKDNVTISIDALLYFQITDPKKAIYEIVNLPEAIEKLTQTTLRNVIGELDLDETLVSRDTINNKLRIILDEATDKWGVKVNRVELQDIMPPVEIREAMEQQMKAERQKRAVILTSEGEKQSKILEAEGWQRAKVLEAEGEKQAEILAAEGVAAKKLKLAEAEKEAIDMVSSAIKGKGKDIVSYLTAVKYIDSFHKMAEGTDNKVVFMPYESSSLLSGLGSIKELFEKNN